MTYKKKKNNFKKKEELFGKQIVGTKAIAIEIYWNTNQKFVLVVGSKNYN